jgi:hypothetical protein
MRRLGFALAMLAAVPALALPVNIQPRGSGAGAPTLGNLTASMTAGASAGTAILTPTVQALPGCSWSIAPTTYFAQSSSTGAITASSTPTSVGTYTPVTTCTATGSQTIAVSATLTITAAGGAFNPSLDFSDARNSQYLAIIL